MQIFTMVEQVLEGALAKAASDGLLPNNLDTASVSVEPPRDPSHGDVSTNIAMVLSKQAKKSPRDIAGILVPLLQAHEHIEQADIAGPGFINLRLDMSCYHLVLKDILHTKSNYGDSELGMDVPVNVEYVSANPTGPMHIGHARGAVYGDALARLLSKAGYKVTKEYYINDAGSQIDTLARSAFLRYKEALGYGIGDIPQGLYPGEYLIPVGKALTEIFGSALLDMDEGQMIKAVKPVVVDAMMDNIRSDLKELGITHDVFSSEAEIKEQGKIEETLEFLKEKGLLYLGILEPPKGKKPDDWEPREQWLFKATEFGDDVDRPLQKSDGTHTYFSADIAYHLDKFQRGFNDMVLVLGADHGGYVKRIKAAVGALSDKKASVDVKLCQLVNFLEDGKPLKMSKRAGTFTTVHDVVNEVGADVVRFIMLTRKNDAVLDFDLKQVKEQSKDNPVFYVQYAHARCQSVLRIAQKDASEALDIQDIDFSLLDDESQHQLMKLLASWPRMVQMAARAYEPHRIAYFIQEVAASFHSLWNKGKENATLRFIITDDIARTAANLALIKATAHVIASALNVIGVEPADVMQ